MIEPWYIQVVPLACPTYFGVFLYYKELLMSWCLSKVTDV